MVLDRTEEYVYIYDKKRRDKTHRTAKSSTKTSYIIIEDGKSLK